MWPHGGTLSSFSLKKNKSSNKKNLEVLFETQERCMIRQKYRFKIHLFINIFNLNFFLISVSSFLFFFSFFFDI